MWRDGKCDGIEGQMISPLLKRYWLEVREEEQLLVTNLGLFSSLESESRGNEGSSQWWRVAI
jgi:hypothetical protein